ncbi:MAG: PTS galactitol transporter subunit IIB [Anaerolineaceae bacterium]
MAKKFILSVCGTGGVTSGVVAEKIRELCLRHGIDAEVQTGKALEVQSRIESAKYDLIASATRIKETTVPVINCMSFLSGVEEEELENKIVDLLK